MSAVGDARKRAAEGEYPEVLSEDVPVPVPWWWTEEGRTRYVAAAKAEALREAADEMPDVRDLTCNGINVDGAHYWLRMHAAGIEARHA